MTVASSQRILIADDHESIRMVVEAMVKLYVSDIARIEKYGNGDDLLLAMLPEAGPVGLLVLDLTMPGYRRRLGLLKAALNLQPNVPILVYTASDSPMLMLKALDIGAIAYVTKGSPYRVLTEGFEHAMLRQQFYDSRINLEDATRHPWWTLTGAEREVLVGLAKGSSLGELATEKKRSYKTMAAHKYNGTGKLGITNSMPIAIYLANEGLDFELDE
ncbi:response regulator transcription factor [Xanthomonas citri]|uniref:response regulator transcription factor n=1 Tax=Xanthomonas citri TaxID=346 RepID=UPI000C3BAF8F|nr:response regulator transcription factor [Xanthomonas citri]SOO14164.1 putative two-component system regulatory protein, luxr family [Xanthomonas citri pv. fuscans]